MRRVRVPLWGTRTSKDAREALLVEARRLGAQRTFASSEAITMLLLGETRIKKEVEETALGW